MKSSWIDLYFSLRLYKFISFDLAFYLILWTTFYVFLSLANISWSIFLATLSSRASKLSDSVSFSRLRISMSSTYFFFLSWIVCLRAKNSFATTWFWDSLCSSLYLSSWICLYTKVKLYTKTYYLSQCCWTHYLWQPYPCQKHLETLHRMIVKTF